MFTTTHTTTMTRVMPPGVVSATQSPTDPSLWTFETESSHLCGLYTSSARYDTTYAPTEDGSTFHVTAALGVSTSGKWTCKEVQPLEHAAADVSAAAPKWTEVTETATIVGPSFLMGLIVSIRKKSHEVLIVRIEERIRADEAKQS